MCISNEVRVYRSLHRLTDRVRLPKSDHVVLCRFGDTLACVCFNHQKMIKSCFASKDVSKTTDEKILGEVVLAFSCTPPISHSNICYPVCTFCFSGQRTRILEKAVHAARSHLQLLWVVCWGGRRNDIQLDLVYFHYGFYMKSSSISL